MLGKQLVRPGIVECALDQIRGERKYLIDQRFLGGQCWYFSRTSIRLPTMLIWEPTNGIG